MPMMDGNAKGMAAGRGAEARAPGPFCSADDLKGVLSDIAAQIADADRRHTATLAAMQERLLCLGREAQALKSQLPDELGADLARVELGMADLSARVAAASSDAGAALAERRIDDATPPDALRSSIVQPPVLASDAGARAMFASAPRVSNIQADPFDFAAHSVAADPQEPWDDMSAQALADLYDTGDAAIPLTTDAGEPVRPIRLPDIATAPLASLAAVAVEQGAGLASARPASDVDRNWLESRFADIAERVEASLAGLGANSSMEALEKRFEDFEQRFDLAMQGVATRADVDGFRTIEAGIVELADHLQVVQAEMARLAAIETQLAAVAGRLSDENLGELIGAAALSPDDVDSVANTIAERLGSKFGASPMAAQSSEMPGELRNIITRFVDEQRLADEHTTSMLDTMQQAMIRMLDRMDQMERMQAPVQSAPVAGTFAMSQGQSRAAVPAGHYAPDLGAFRAEPEPAPVGSRYSAAPTNGSKEPPRWNNDERADDDGLSVIQNDQVDTGRSASVGGAERGQPASRSREDFVAAARRAMRQAASEAAEPAPEPIVVAPRAPASKSSRSATEGAKSRLGLSGGMRQGLVIGMVALLAVGGAIAAFTKLRGGPVSTAKVERRLLTPETETLEKSAVPTEIRKSAPARAAQPPAAMAPAQLPLAGESGAGVGPAPAPAQPKSLRPKPESMVDELSSNTPVDGEAQQLAQPASAIIDEAASRSSREPEVLRGITIQQSSRLPTPQELIRAQERHRMATMSSKLGEAQPPAVVAPASLIPGMPGMDAQPSATDAAEISNTPQTDMPPAMIGPNSLRIAAAKGDASAEFEVAARFAEGKGVQQDFKQAIHWYNRAAARGFAIAQYRLGTLYERGLGTKADPARAKSWYQRAAEQGNVKAMHNLAVIAAGQSQGADYATAVRWFQEAAERGLADSQYNLAVLIESGLGVPRDTKQAYVWLALAAASGDKEAARRREQVRSTLDPASHKAAHAIIDTWRPKQPDLMANDARAAGEAWKARHAIQPNG